MRFQLVRYFTIASLAMFGLVAAVLTHFQGVASAFFEDVQSQQNQFFSQVQQDFAKQQDQAALRDLLSIHESGNVNLTRLFANALWEKDFAPFVAKAQSIDVEACRAMPDIQEPSGKAKQSPEKKACFTDVGQKIQAFKEFKALDAKVFDSMKKSTVFKIKVFDLRGITVYSSEHKQMGEDKLGNAGWKGAAVDGKATSELTHRDKFSAFEGVVENRDLISSYLPVLAPGSEKIVGVFEVYSDVTPFLGQIKNTSTLIKKAAATNQTKVEQVASDSAAEVNRNATQLFAIVVGMLVLLFVSLFAIVRRADQIIVQQSQEREKTQQQLAQSEKMASLGQMVAGVTHQLNTPLAFSHNNVSMVIEALKSFPLPLKVANSFAKAVMAAEGDRLTINVAQTKAQVASINESDTDVVMLSEMLGDTLMGIDQMRELVENLRDFTRLDRSKVSSFDLNKGLHNVIYLARSVASTSVNIVEEFGELPMLECNPSQLNQVFLNLINNAAQSISGEGTVTVRSSTDGGRIRVDVVDTGSGIPADVLPHIFENYFTTKPSGEGTGLGLAIAQDIVREHGGEIQVATTLGTGSSFSVYFPATATSGG
jgi:two-component system NtrC family sensor kinase